MLSFGGNTNACEKAVGENCLHVYRGAIRLFRHPLIPLLPYTGTAQVLAVGTATVQVRKQWPQLVEVQRSSREAQVGPPCRHSGAAVQLFLFGIGVCRRRHSGPGYIGLIRVAPLHTRRAAVTALGADGCGSRVRQALMEQRRSEVAQTKDTIKVCRTVHIGRTGTPHACRIQRCKSRESER